MALPLEGVGFKSLRVPAVVRILDGGVRFKAMRVLVQDSPLPVNALEVRMLTRKGKLPFIRVETA